MKYQALLAVLALAGTATWGQASETEAKINVPELWTKHCASCHGKDGKGQTKAGQKARVKDFTDATYQNGFTDEAAFKATKFGMKDGQREQMKAFEPHLNDAEIKALIAHVRQFVKK